MSVERQIGRKDPRIHHPTPIPELGFRVWNVFWEVNKARQGTGFGPAAIPNVELKAWCELMNEQLDPWEITIFRRLDSIYLNEVFKKQNEGT